MSAAIADPPRLFTIEEYVRLPDDGRKTELIRGRVVEVPPTYPYHGRVCFKVAKLVDNFVEAGKLGRVITNDSGVVTERDPDTLRGADVCYYSFMRLPAGSMPKNAYLDVMPELVFEVRSPSDRRSQVLAKVTEYLTAGVTVVCVMNPESGTAVVYRDNQDPESFASDVELVFPDLLPGFRVPMSQFFE